MHRFLRFLFLCVDSLLLGLFAVGYMAAYLDPRVFWWPGIVAVALPYVSLLLAGMSVVVLLRYRNRRWLLLMHGLALAFIAFRFVHVERWVNEAEPSEEDLVLMTFNIPLFPESERANQTVTALARAYEPHIVGVQETAVFRSRRAPHRLVGQAKVRALIDSLGYTSLPPPRLPEERAWVWHQPVLARLDLVHQEQIELRHTPDDQASLKVLRTEFMWQGRPAVHYNLHLHTHGAEKPWDHDEVPLFDPAFWAPYLETYKKGMLKRAWQAEEVRKRVDAETKPVIISGDFNSTPHEWAYRRLADGFQDVFALAGTGWGGTYRIDWPLVRIDYVLLSPEWEAVSAVVPPSNSDVSDHRPLVAWFRWATEE